MSLPFMDSQRLALAYIAELLDRVIRFDMHLSVVADEFYSAGTHSKGGLPAAERPLFLDSFKECVDELVRVVFALVGESANGHGENDQQIVMLKAKHGFLVLAELHEAGLLHLPRPSEPTELRRFLRMISKHVLNRARPDLAVYMTEATVESAFPDDPVQTLKTHGGVAAFARMTEGFPPVTSEAAHDHADDRGIHVTIPRVDARNPLRWPSLMHEAAHKLISAEVIGSKDIDFQFLESLPPAVADTISQLKIDLRSWLTEVWCDLFASLVLGPSFFFSQYSAFVSSPSDGTLNSRYPPHGVRLFLIANCLRHRHREITALPNVRKHMDDCAELVDYWDKFYGLDLRSNDALKVVVDAMRQFFMEHFFGGSGSDSENVRQKYDKMIRYVRDIEATQLERTQRSIAEGLPVPSKPARSGPWYLEEPTSIQEVLLAAWLDRLSRLLPESLSPQTSGLIRSRAELIKPFVRFDETVLRSLQISEWLHVLVEEGTDETDFTASHASVGTPGFEETEHLITDRGIAALLKDGELRIVPLVNLDQQLGAVSIDIRLGTSFEIYLPAYVRQASSGFREPDAYSAKSIDLDFLEHVVLLPGQMVLAHSFEYLRLPQGIAAELEGRSSYARLGLEIHLTAGMIDPGFEGTITFEMVNNGPNPISLFPGIRIGQLRLIRVSQPMRPYSSKRGAKYGGLLHQSRSRYTDDGDYKRLINAISQQEDSHSINTQLVGLAAKGPK